MKKILVVCSTLCLSTLSINAFAAYGQDWESNYPEPTSGYEYNYKKNSARSAHRSYARYQEHGTSKNHGKRHRHSTKGESSSKSQSMEKSPLPQTIAAPGQKTIKINLSKRVFGAYDSSGNLLKWGRVSGGKNYCPDIGRSCRTPTGSFTIYSKKGSECKSSRFPLPNGGARMPYCMHFHGGYAMHGGHVPNYNASHGCVRLHHEDARWLNQQFVQVGSTKVNITR